MSCPVLVTEATAEEQTAHEIMSLLIPHRRTIETDAERDTTDDFPEQLLQIADFVRRDEPVLFTLPGFPCKSPNPAKVLGHLPDQGERLALRFLDSLCARIGKVYNPGAQVLICSDGHIFGDVIGVPDAHIDAYGDTLRTMIREEGLQEHLRTFDLRDVYGTVLSYDDKRRQVTERYGPELDALREEVRNDGSTLRMYRGITRFLVEDTADWSGSRSALQRDCRRRAYETIQRSRAWGELIAAHHPHNVRLSIHPQNRGEGKFGIQLLGAADAWTTPWHSALLYRPDGSWELMRRTDAARLGREVYRDGRPSHFEAVDGAASGTDADAPAHTRAGDAAHTGADGASGAGVGDLAVTGHGDLTGTGADLTGTGADRAGTGADRAGDGGTGGGGTND